MNIIAIHKISDPAKFWEVLGSNNQLPEGVKVQGMLPGTDGSIAVCIWQADSLETVKNIVVSAVGKYSSNEFFAVDASKAFGLPG